MTTSNDIWFNKRSEGLGGSEIACLFGESPFMTNIDLWNIKTGKKQVKRVINEEQAQWGHDREKNLLDWFRNTHTDKIVVHNTHNFVFKNKEKPFILGTLDSIAKDKFTNKRSIVEFKTYMLGKGRKKWEETIPQYYFYQILQYFLATDFDDAYLIVEYYYMTPDGIKILEPVEFYFERKDYLEDLEIVKNTEIHFWEYNVKKEIMPTLQINLF